MIEIIWTKLLPVFIVFNEELSTSKQVSLRYMLLVFSVLINENNYKLKQIKQKTSWVKEIELLKLNFNFKVNVITLDFSLKNGLVCRGFVLKASLKQSLGADDNIL